MGLPGIGQRTARRMAFHMLGKKGRASALSLADSIVYAIKNVRLCDGCRSFADEDICNICNSANRDNKVLCVVETTSDVVSIEEAGVFFGKYFVLHGSLSPLDDVGPVDLCIPELLSKLSNACIDELIIATGSTAEGNATAHYISSKAKKLLIKCTRIAHGIPLGGELEYLDSGTLRHSFNFRIPFD